MPPHNQLILVTGAARSGKSEWAELLAAQSGQAVVYVATSQVEPTDQAWQARIAAHRHRRPPQWTTLEVAVELPATIQQASEKTCLLVDSLGTWVANQMQDESWEQTAQTLLQSLQQARCSLILVAEETGWGVVPAYASGRTFRDRLGHLVRQIGTMADPVYLVVGGHVLNLSELGTPLPRSP